MGLTERIYEVSRELPETALTELLDFAEFLQQKKVRNVLLTSDSASDDEQRGSVTRTLALLATPRFAQRPKAQGPEVEQRIAILRGEWDEH